MNWTADFSFWWIFPWLIISIFLGIFLYRKTSWIKELTEKQRVLLIGLRTAVLFVLGVLLLGVLFESKSFRDEKPVFITLIDDSVSMLNYKDSNSVKKDISELQKKLKTRFGDRFDWVEAKLTKENNKASDFSGVETDLSGSLGEIRSNYYNRNVGGIMLISDGNYNKGVSPLYSAEKFNLIPFFTIGVGDTVAKKDQYIKQVTSNDFAFFKNQFPVEVDIESIKLQGKIARIDILRDGNVVATQKVNYEKSTYSFKQINFLLTADRLGVQRYSIRLQSLDGEYSLKNNQRDFYIEVLDSRSKVLILSSAPHPDVTAIKSVMDLDENLSVVTSLSKDWNKDTKDVDLVIWHEPGLNYDPSIWSVLQQKNLPVLFIVGPNSKSKSISDLGLGLNVPSGQQTDEVEAKYNNSFLPFEISEELKSFFNYLPPLKSKFGQMNLPNGTDIFLYQRLGTIQKKDPLIFFGKRKDIKYGVIYGEGVWKWKLNDYVRNNNFDLFNEFLQKITQYLVVRQNSSPFIVTLPKRLTKADELLVKAEFYNESMELITTPSVKFQLKNEKGIENKLEFGKTGNSYRLNLGKLKPGSYDWKASTSFSGNRFEKKGRFIVEDIVLESLDNQANHGLLKQVAKVTNGEFTTLDDVDRLLNKIDKREDLVSMSYAESNFNDLIDLKWLFALLFLMIGVEWLLRRWWGGY
jgi:hypothetical protein